MGALKLATGLFFTGGDQLHVTSLLGGTAMHKLIGQLYEAGVVIGGTSAGAAMMSNSMIIRGESTSPPRLRGVELAPGMDFIPGTMIDTHFTQRGRIGRLITAVAHYPQDLGFGIDENTAILVKGDEFEVIGENSVTVVDAGAITYTDLPQLEDGQTLSLYGVRVHVLAAGHRFNIKERSPIEENPESAERMARRNGNGSGKAKAKANED